MFFLGCTKRIIKYLLFSILASSLQCLATDDIAEMPKEDGEYLDNDFFRFTTEKRYIWDEWTHEPRPPYGDRGYSGGGDPTIFFIILGVGIIIFVGLLFLCKKARDVTNSDSRTVPGTVTHPPSAGAGGIDATISIIGSTSNNPSQGRPGIFRQTSEKPPDYATVTLGDLSNAKSPFPSVLRQKSSETPPPKYDENNPMFK